MDAVTLILIVLAAFNLSLLVMKVWGDKFPQPHARNLHANWLQGWRNTQNPLRRFWVQVILMFLIMMLFNVADEMFVGFLVFVRLIVYCMGYKRAKQQLAQATFQLP
jgi:amino acid transporter